MALVQFKASKATWCPSGPTGCRRPTCCPAIPKGWRERAALASCLDTHACICKQREPCSDKKQARTFLSVKCCVKAPMKVSCTLWLRNSLTMTTLVLESLMCSTVARKLGTAAGSMEVEGEGSIMA